MILSKPHTVTIQAVEQTRDDRNVQTGTRFVDGKPIACQVTPERTKNVQDRYGIDTVRPFLVLCDVGDVLDPETLEEIITVGTRLKWKDKTLTVKMKPEIYDGIGIADHASFIADNVPFVLKGNPNNAG